MTRAIADHECFALHSGHDDRDRTYLADVNVIYGVRVVPRGSKPRGLPFDTNWRTYVGQ